MTSYDDDLVQEVSLTGSTLPATADFFRLAAGEKRRISFVWLRADGSPRILSAAVQYFSNVGKIISRLGKDGADADQVWTEGEAPRPSYVTLVLVYPRGADGKLDRDRLLTGIDVLKWSFSEKTFGALQKIGASSSLGRVDIWATCSDERYQRLDFARINGCLWWTDEEAREGILRRVKELESSVSPGRKLSTEELAAKLGKTWPPQPEFVPGDMNADLENLLDENGSV